jgi:hypothetical protein
VDFPIVHNPFEDWRQFPAASPDIRYPNRFNFARANAKRRISTPATGPHNSSTDVGNAQEHAGLCAAFALPVTSGKLASTSWPSEATYRSERMSSAPSARGRGGRYAVRRTRKRGCLVAGMAVFTVLVLIVSWGKKAFSSPDL